MYDHKITCEWGISGLTVEQKADIIIIVDVLSFSTCVDIVVSNHAIVYPYRYKDKTAITFSEQKNAILALPRNMSGYTLSPHSLLNIQKNTKLVLPSPNGSTLATQARADYILTGCLRNASAIANAAMQLGKSILLIPAGEMWSDNTMRVSYEDLIGAGAIIHSLKGNKSEEASIAEKIFLDSQKQCFLNIFSLKSGLELIEWGFKGDIELACQYDISQSVPVLKKEFFINLEL